MKQFRTKIILSCSAFLLSLFFLELFFRFFLPQPISALKNDLKRGRFKEAGVYKNHTPEFQAEVIVNQEGFVDHSWEINSEDSIALLVGDSFVQAAQVNLEDGWGRKLDQLFQQNQANIKVLSLGIPGAGIATEFELIKQYTPKSQPKIIYFSFLVDNDIFNNHPELEAKQDKPFYQLQNDQLHLIWKESSEQESIILKNSHLTRWIHRKLWKKKEGKRRMTKGDGVPLNFHVHKTPPTKLWQESWETTQKAFTELSNYCNEHNIELKIVLTPAHWQVSPSKAERLKKQFPLMKNWDIENYAYQRSATILQELGLTTIDLYPQFRNHPDPDLLYFPIDAHWTKEGHALAAEILYTNWKDLNNISEN